MDLKVIISDSTSPSQLSELVSEEIGAWCKYLWLRKLGGWIRIHSLGVDIKKKKKVLFENEKMPCACPEGAEYFCDRKAERSESQRRNQFCSWENVWKLGKWRIHRWGFWCSHVDMKVFVASKLSIHPSVLAHLKQVRSYWHLPRSDVFSGAFICTAAQFIFVNISDGAPSLGLGTREGRLPRWRWSCG